MMALRFDRSLGPLARSLLLTVLVYAAIAWATEAPFFILILNGLGLSIGAGVCVAYAPILPGALCSREPTKGEYLGTGIFMVSLYVVGRCLLSVVARDFAYPDVYNTDVMTGVMAVGLYGALLHLWAPNAVEGRVPRANWVSTGIVVAIGLFLAFLLWTATRHGVAHPKFELR